MADISYQRKILPQNFVYERRASTLTSSVPATTSGYKLLEWYVPRGKPAAVIYSIGTDQHMSSTYTWVFDGYSLPISGAASPGSIEHPYIFPEPILVSSSIILYIGNANAVAYPNTGVKPDDEFPYECVVNGRYEST